MPPINTTFRTFILHEQRFTLGDAILIRSDGGSNLDYIAVIEKISTNDIGEVYVGVRWYYRPEELPWGRQSFHGKDEVIESDHTDTIHVLSVDAKCIIHTLEQYEARQNAGPKLVNGYVVPELFARSYFKRKAGRLREPLPTYCYCKHPQNPDELLISCDKCDKWYHGPCVGLKDAPATRWVCPACKGRPVPKTAKAPLSEEGSICAGLAQPKPGKAKTTKDRTTSKTSSRRKSSTKASPKSAASTKASPKSAASTKASPKSAAGAKASPKSAASTKASPKSAAITKASPKSAAGAKRKSAGGDTTPKRVKKEEEA